MMLVSISFCMFGDSVSALTTVPTKTNFQGRLTNSVGNIMPDGTYNMRFRLYTVSSGGVAVWSEDRLVSATQGVQVTNGLFSVRLGDVTPLSASLFSSGALYFEIELPTPGTATSSSPSWTEGPMTPRNQLATSAYAYNSETLDGLDSADFGQIAANNTWTGTNAFNGSTFSIGGAANAAKFSVGSLFNVDTSASIVTISANSLFNTGTFTVNNNSPTFKNTADNATAFRIQDASSANMFVTDTSTKRIYIGDPTPDANGVVLVLDNKSGVDPTGTAGGMYYNTTNGKFRCYQNGAWRDCTSSTQDAYNLSVGGTTPETKVDSTRGGVDIQDADTTINGNLFTVRAANGTGLGTAMFNVTSSGAVTAQNVTDSTAAFTISRAGSGGSLLVADTTNSQVQIGSATADATGVVLVLDTKNTSGDPTGASATNGATYYNSNTGKFRCYQGGAWRDCTSSLQDAYNLSVGGTTPEIKADTTRGGLDIQDADTTTGGDLLTVRGSNGAGLGSSLFAVSSTGTVNVQNSANSATSFVIRNQGGNEVFLADTTNSRVYVGDTTPDTTGVVFVLDTKTDAGDPTGIDGAMYYNSSMKAFRCYQNGVWRSCLGGLVYANTSASNSINSTNVDTAFNTSHTIPAGSCQTGRVYRVVAKGVISTYNAGLGNPGTISLRVKIGGTTVGTATSANLTNSMANRGWGVEFNITCANFASNQVEGQGTARVFTTATASQDLEMANSAVVTVPSLASAQTLSMSAQWGTANAGNIITLRQLVVEELGP